MDDLISRQALCEYALNQKDKSVTPNDIMRFPSALAVRKKGKWVFEEYPDGYYHSECSECKHYFIEDAYLKPYNFCPNCGADMRGEQE